MKKIFYIVMILQPIIDVLTSLMVRFYPNIASIGQLLRAIILVAVFLFITFKTTNRRRDYSIILVLIVFSLLYLYNQYFILRNPIFLEFSAILKFNYFILLTMGFIEFLKLKLIDKSDIEKVLFINALIIFSILLISIVTKTSFFSYSYEQKGVIGWFFSANEIGVIIFLLMSVIFHKLMDKAVYLILFFLMFYIFIQIGTKVSVYGLLLPPIILLIFLLRKKNNIKEIIKVGSVFLLSGLLILFSKTIVRDFSKLNNPVVNDTILNKTNAILSGRLEFLKMIGNKFINSPINVFLLGLGHQENGVLLKGVEMDFFDILFNFGIFGFLIYLVFTLIVFKEAIFNIFKKDTSLEKYTFSVTLIIGMSIGILIGHVYLAPAVSTYLALISGYVFLREDNLKEK
ncbi:MAG: hypothetical protein GX914_05365 [Erysipelotrichia bacterium]|nr:hypothetical protein [Erysipelotrichia bacterium]